MFAKSSKLGAIRWRVDSKYEFAPGYQVVRWYPRASGREKKGRIVSVPTNVAITITIPLLFRRKADD
jgi:hypothetical protein